MHNPAMHSTNIKKITSYIFQPATYRLNASNNTFWEEKWVLSGNYGI
jgi:hypothetical protein